MDPNQQPQNPNSGQYGPPNYGPGPQQGAPNTLNGQPPVVGPVATKSKLPIVIAAAAGVLLLLIGGVIIFATPSKKNAKLNPGDPKTQSQGPQPATAIGVTQTNTSISQDLSTLNDDKDLAPTMLDDQTLGL